MKRPFLAARIARNSGVIKLATQMAASRDRYHIKRQIACADDPAFAFGVSIGSSLLDR
jgi:hypothetical protein